MSGEGATRKAIEAVWRIESARLIGGLVRMVRDVGLAEDLAQEALVTALEHWPRTGIPDTPGAWLMATAKNRALDHLRRGSMIERKSAAIGEDTAALHAPAIERAIDEDVGDDLLRLILVACHPVLSAEARAALTLRLLGGLTTAEIARAFLVPEATIAQRTVRAKRTLAEARVPFEVPRGAELAARLPSVLEVIYLIFNEGYAATHGDDWMRLELCEDALRLGRILASLVPGEPEVHGLVALMELHASRARARVSPSGEPILLLDQDRARWGVKALGQFCSIARALDVLGERWSLLVVREILCGSHRFGDIRRGIPRISRTMLAARLRELVDIGVLARAAARGGPTYELTEAGRELESVVRDLGVWGQRWLPRTLRHEELDADTLLWDVRRRVRVEELPPRPIVVRFDFSEARASRANLRFLLLRRSEVSLCNENPGFPEELCISGSLRVLTAWWRGDLTFAAARSAGMAITGRREWVRAFPSWFLRYAFAEVSPAGNG